MPVTGRLRGDLRDPLRRRKALDVLFGELPGCRFYRAPRLRFGFAPLPFDHCARRLFGFATPRVLAVT